jgi:hypothetical protein
MSDNLTLEQVEALAAKLAPDDRRTLAERLLRGLAAPEPDQAALRWSDIRGALAYPACREDAQEWVTRSRREADERRERQGGPDHECYPHR